VHSKSNNWLRNISFLLWNAQSLNNQIHNLQSYNYSKDFDVIAITETWLTKHIHTNELLPCSYNILQKDRDERRGGVILALKDSISFRKLSNPNDLEVLSAEVNINNLNFVICIFRLCSIISEHSLVTMVMHKFSTPLFYILLMKLTLMCRTIWHKILTKENFDEWASGKIWWKKIWRIP